MPQVTLADLESRVWSRVDQNTAFYPQAQVDRLINEGSRNVNLFSGFNQAAVPLGLTVAGWQWYRVPAPIVVPMRLYMEGRMLFKTSVSAVSSAAPRWMRAASPLRARSWAPVGTQMFGLIDPDPLGGRYLEMWGVTTPPLLASGSDTLLIDDEYASLIVDYAVINLTLKEGGKVFADSSKSYNSWLKRMRDLQMFEMKINPRYYVETATPAAVPA